MVEGSPEVHPLESMDPAQAESAIAEIAAQRAAESASGAEDQAGATETTAAPDTAAKPAPAPEPEKAPGAEAGKPPTDPEVDLSHLPGDLLETARGLPVEQQQAIDKVYRAIQSDADKKRESERAEIKALRELASDGEHFRKIASSDDTEARDLMFKALDKVSGAANGQAAPAPDDVTPEFLSNFGAYVEMDPKEQAAFATGLRSMIREEASRIAGETVDERVHQPVARADSIRSVARDVATAAGLEPEAAVEAWVGFLKVIGEDNVQPENVSVLFTPYAQNAALKAQIAVLQATPGTPAPAPAKPTPAGGSRAASLTDQSSTVETEYVPAYVRENRPPTSEEGVAEMLRKVGVSRSDLTREMQDGGFYY